MSCKKELGLRHQHLDPLKSFTIPYTKSMSLAGSYFGCSKLEFKFNVRSSYVSKMQVCKQIRNELIMPKKPQWNFSVKNYMLI